MVKKRILPLLPFLILAGIALFSLGEFLFMDYIATTKHRIAFGLLAVNVCLYFFQWRAGVLATGVVLLLATFNLISFYCVTTYFSFSMFGISTPGVQPSMLFLLIGYILLEFNLLANWYLDYKESKESKER